MAAVVVVNQSERHVAGDLRMVGATLTIANTGDTWVVPGIHSIRPGAQATPDTARSCGMTFTGNTVTFLTSAGNVSFLCFGT